MEQKLSGNEINEKVMRYLKEGMKLFKGNKIDAAFNMFNAAIKLDNQCAEAYIIKGEAFMEMLDMEEAEKCIKQYLELMPKDLRAYNDLMNIYYESYDFNNALIYCNMLLEKDAENPDLLSKKAYFLSNLDDVDQALEYYDKAIELKPDFYEAIFDKAKLLSECGCEREALTVYKQAILVDSNKPDAYMEAAFIYLNLGDKKTAIEFSKKAHELEPDNDFYQCHSEIISYI